ncbi:hypothetical protein AURDEDRAFT_114705 [Auricularia subglabra TFB-10046 SS5]|nr:hypothetical protein AURDEDRAFT_114705 [Auricularia subglabra TFB-10046 SS5]
MDPEFGQLYTFPNLLHLKVGSTDGSYSPTTCEAIARLLANSCPNVTRVSLVSIHVDRALSSACRALPNLRSLVLRSLALRTSALFDTPESTAVFPALRRLSIEVCDCAGSFTGETLLDFIRVRYGKAAAGRAQGGGFPQLLRVGVSWNEEQLTEEHDDNLIDGWDAKFAESVGPSDWGDSSDEDELEKRFMGWNV